MSRNDCCVNSARIRGRRGIVVGVAQGRQPGVRGRRQAVVADGQAEDRTARLGRRRARTAATPRGDDGRLAATVSRRRLTASVGDDPDFGLARGDDVVGVGARQQRRLGQRHAGHEQGAGIRRARVRRRPDGLAERDRPGAVPVLAGSAGASPSAEKYQMSSPPGAGRRSRPGSHRAAPRPESKTPASILRAGSQRRRRRADTRDVQVQPVRRRPWRGTGPLACEARNQQQRRQPGQRRSPAAVTPSRNSTATAPAEARLRARARRPERPLEHAVLGRPGKSALGQQRIDLVVERPPAMPFISADLFMTASPESRVILPGSRRCRW